MRKKRILITDDDLGILEVLQIIFEHAGYEVDLIPDAKKLLDQEFRIPDLFILDKQLSGYDGLDICKFLKKQESSKSIPIVMISATPNLEVRAREAGANFFIEKPFDVQTLLETVENFTN